MHFITKGVILISTIFNYFFLRKDMSQEVSWHKATMLL